MPQDVEVFPIIDVPGSEADYGPAASNGVDAGQIVETRHQTLMLWVAAREAEAHRNQPLARRFRPLIDIEHVTLRGTLDSRLVLLNQPGSDRTRGYRLLRHRLFSSGDPRIVAVTSAHPGEGKTTCALNLALAIAEDTMTRTLLLEANLARPALGEVFDFAPSRSIVEKIIRFTCLGPPYPVVSISGTRLHASPLPDAPLEGRLDRTLFGAALSELREAYDYIVIDAASVLESGDVDVVGECSDAVIVAVRAGRSSKRDLRSAIAQLAPAPVLGSVLIDA
jgi:Mrp family chromosome partitioning ATPase